MVIFGRGYDKRGCALVDETMVWLVKGARRERWLREKSEERREGVSERANERAARRQRCKQCT